MLLGLGLHCWKRTFTAFQLLLVIDCFFLSLFFQSSPVKYVRDGNLAIKHVALKDDKNSAAVPLSLFGEDAERQYAVGDVISVTDVYKYKKADSLSTKPSSTVQVRYFPYISFLCSTKSKCIVM